MRSLTRALLLLTALLPATGATAAGTHQFIETFSTTQYDNSAFTTANWDTALGRLEGYAFIDSIRGRFPTSGIALDVAVAGRYAFVVDFGGGLSVVDISNPKNPVLTGSYITGFAGSVRVDGDYAYLTNDDLLILDISNPASPAFVGKFVTPDFAIDVEVDGDLAYIADSDSGLYIVDVSTPTTPVQVGHYDTPGVADRLHARGDLVYLADETSLQIIDVTVPSAPALTGSYATTLAFDVFVDGHHAYVADGGLTVLDVSTPASPALVGSYPSMTDASGVTVAGDYAFVAGNGGQLVVLDVTDPTAPVLDQAVNLLSTNPISVVVGGELAYVADGDSGLVIVDIADPTLAVESGSYDIPNVSDVVMNGDYAYAFDDNGVLTVLDIEDLTAPAYLGAVSVTGAHSLPVQLAARGRHVFVAQGGFAVVDVGDPANPAVVGVEPAVAGGGGIAVAGDYAFVGGIGTFEVVDIQDPSSPTRVDSVATVTYVGGVAVSGDYAFLAAYDAGLDVYDISDPTAVAYVATFVHELGLVSYLTVAPSGDYLFAGDADVAGGTVIIDITNPTAPALVQELGSGGVPDLAIHGNYLHLLDNGPVQLSSYNISDPPAPSQPVFMQFFTPSLAPRYPESLAVSGGNALLADATGVFSARVLERSTDHARNLASSKMIPLGDPVPRLRVSSSVETGGVQWVLGGSTVDLGEWWDPGSTITQLQWLAVLYGVTPGVVPSVDEVTFEWLLEPACIDSITDVPNDQGSWAYLYFTRSGYDFADEPAIPVSAYNVHRRIDAAALASNIVSFGVRDEETGLYLYEEGKYRVNGPQSAAPPGVWAVVATVLAQQQDQYVALVPTLGDSMAVIPYSHYYVSAHTTTPSVFFDSPVDSGFSVDNIAPAVPSSVAAAYNTGSGNQLSWDPSPDDDFQYFRIYRSTDPNFVPGPGNLVDATTGTAWTDTEFDGWAVYYKITALDYAGNESDPGMPESATSVPDVLPDRFALHQNVPNPFNPTTAVYYDLPFDAGVRLRIYDVAGRLVRSLVDGPQTRGRKRAVWDGTNDAGQRVSSGVYFYRLEAPAFAKTRRMVLLK